MRPVRLLLDENLSPAVALRLQVAGVDAVHVRDRGLLGRTDAEVFGKAFDEDRIVVTSNITDFLAVARVVEIHAGIILVEDGDLVRDEQEVVLHRAIAALEGEQQAGRDLLNRVLRVGRAGNVTFDDIPDSGHLA